MYWLKNEMLQVSAIIICSNLTKTTYHDVSEAYCEKYQSEHYHNNRARGCREIVTRHNRYSQARQYSPCICCTPTIWQWRHKHPLSSWLSKTHWSKHTILNLVNYSWSIGCLINWHCHFSAIAHLQKVPITVSLENASQSSV